MGTGLDKTTLKNSLKTLFQQDIPAVSDSFKQADRDSALTKAESIATSIADAVDVFVKSGKITVNVAATVPLGIPVATAGTPAAQTGATTAPSTATQTIITGVE